MCVFFLNFSCFLTRIFIAFELNGQLWFAQNTNANIQFWSFMALSLYHSCLFCLANSIDPGSLFIIASTLSSLYELTSFLYNWSSSANIIGQIYISSAWGSFEGQKSNWTQPFFHYHYHRYHNCRHHHHLPPLHHRRRSYHGCPLIVIIIIIIFLNIVIITLSPWPPWPLAELPTSQTWQRPYPEC